MKNSLLLIAIGFALGVILSLLMNNCFISDDFSYKSCKSSPVPQIKLKLQKEDQKLAVALDSLAEKNKMLVSEMNSSKSLLQKAQKKNIILQTQMYELIDRNIADTSERLASCDSLEERVEDLMILNDYKDSLFTDVDFLHQQHIKNKDSTIDLISKHNINLSTELAKSLDQQQSLESQNKQLSKSMQRQKTKSKIIKRLLFIAGGIAAGQILNR